MTKDERRKLIAERATTSPKKYATYWMTRDLVSGALDPGVKIWTAVPARALLIPVVDDTVMWLALNADGTTAYWQTWTVPECLKEARVYPDDHRQVIRVGDDLKA